MFNEIILRQRNCVLLHMVWLYSGLKVPAQQYIIVMDTSTKRRKAKTKKRKALIQVEVRNFRICPKSEKKNTLSTGSRDVLSDPFFNSHNTI